jgi:hypothetical protein
MKIVPQKGEDYQYLSSVQRSPIGLRGKHRTTRSAFSATRSGEKNPVDPKSLVASWGLASEGEARSGFHGHVDSITQASQKIYGPRAYPSHPKSGTMFPSNATPMAR